MPGVAETIAGSYETLRCIFASKRVETCHDELINLDKANVIASFHSFFLQHQCIFFCLYAPNKLSFRMNLVSTVRANSNQRHPESVRL